jgi:lipoic acid synthetase
MIKKTNPEYSKQNTVLRRPDWLKVKFGSGESFRKVRSVIHTKQLHTVCESARCPNLGECWSRGTATFMILGDTCTRSCSFCNIKTGVPEEYDKTEPRRIAEAVKQINLRHAVITMVTRDDLDDGGAFLMAETIRRIKKRKSDCTVEALISDLKGKKENLEIVLAGEPDIVNHNLETIGRLQEVLRPQANYQRSLQILTWAKEKRYVTKSGFMVGIGENFNEIIGLMRDLRAADCDIITIGQYLPPTKHHYPLHRYYHPDEFVELKETGLKMGFTHVESNPLVRSSYHAEEQVNKNIHNEANKD